MFAGCSQYNSCISSRPSLASQAAPRWSEKGGLCSVRGQNALYAPLLIIFIPADHSVGAVSVQEWNCLTLSWLAVVSRLLFNAIDWSSVSSRQQKHLRRSIEVTQRCETMSRGNVCIKIAFSALSLAFHLCLWTLRLFSFFRKKCKISPDHPQGCTLLLKRLMVRWICVCVRAHMANTCKRTHTI